MPASFRRFCALVICIVLTRVASAQSTTPSSLAGTLTLGESGPPLVGATVQIDAQKAVTDARGRFVLTNLSVGPHVLVIVPAEDARVEKQIELIAGKNRLPPLAIIISGPATPHSDSIQVLDKLVVSEKAGSTAARFENKAGTEALTEIVSERDLKNPNAQTGSDLLKNTSGVTVSAGAGGTSNVSVRGIDQRMLRITVDGQRQGGSGNALDSIPPEIVQSLEVTKTFTPDMEADAVGGVININTGGTVVKTGYVQGRHQLTYNSLISRPGTRNTVTVAKPFSFLAPKPNASFTATASFEDQYKVRERISALREWTPQVSPGPTPHTGQSIAVLTQPLIESTLEHRQRTGLVVNGDARLGDTALFVRANYGRDWARRNRDYNDTDPAAGTVQSLTPTTGVFSGVRQSHRNQVQIATRDALNFSAGGKTRAGNIDLDLTVAYSFAIEEEPETLETVFLSTRTYRMTYDLADPYEPAYTLVDETNPADTASARDAALYRFDYLTLTESTSDDQEGTVKFNAKIPLGEAGKSENYLKFGGKAQQRHRTVEIDRDVFDPGALPLPLSGVTGSPWVAMDTVNYQFGPVANSEAVNALRSTTPAAFSKNQTESAINSEGGDYAITETVWALYAMGKVKLDRWTVLGGVRVEGTHVNSGANEMNFNPGGQLLGFTPARAETDYTEILPGLHLRFDPVPGLLYRSSITRSLSRPAYADIAPFRTLSFVDRRSRIGAPDLKPYQSTNLDLSVDKYDEAYGLLSLAVFYKKIDHFITDAQYRTQIGNLGQFTEFKRVNGESAFATGFEATWQSPTKTLLAGLGRGSVEANYSFNHGEARHPTRPGETFPLPRQVDHQAGLKFHDERGPLSLDLAVRYRSGWWEDLIAAGYDNYIEPAWDVEISGVYKLGKNTRVSAGVSNLLNIPTRHYAGHRSRMNDSQENGIDFTVGVQWKL